MAKGLECFRLLFPKGMDANAYASSVKPAEKSLGMVIRSAQWMGRGVRPVPAPAIAAPSPSAAPELPPLLAAETNTLAPPAEAIGAVEERAAKKDALPAPIQVIPPQAQSMLPEPEAAVVPAGPVSESKDDAGCQADEQQLIIAFGERRYRVRGVPKQLTEALKVNVLVTCSGAQELTPAAAAEAGLHVDTLDLYQAKARAAFAKLASLNTVALGAEEPPIPLEGGFGRALKHNAEKLCAVGFKQRASEHAGQYDGHRPSSTHTADCPGCAPHNLRYVQVPAAACGARSPCADC